MSKLLGENRLHRMTCECQSVLNVGLGTRTKRSTPIWAGASEMQHLKKEKPDGENVHTHNLKHVFSSNENSKTAQFSPVIKTIYASIILYVQKNKQI